MDQSTHDVRMTNWLNIISQCQNRPAGISAKQWLAENDLKADNVLERVYFTKAQYNLTKKDRLKNLKNAFSLKKNSSVMNKNCLLVDDIYTTGITMSICAGVLKEHGAAKIYGLVLASDAE